jgi:hypothetical protein
VDELDENGEEKLYRPTGPDGRGWGEYRILTSQDIQTFERLKEDEEEVETRRHNIVSGGAGAGFVADEDERWEKQFEKLVDEQKEAQESKYMHDKLEKERKKAKKKMKKDKKEEKKLLKEKKREEKLIEIYKSFGN